MAERAKHAFGTLENIDQALANGTIDSYDILFVKDVNGKPYVGWIDKEGNKVVCDDSAEFAELESQIATKISAEEVDVKISKKADTTEVDAKIGRAMTDTVATAKSYIDGKVDAALNEHMVKKYEISNTPKGTLVDYGESEIRVLCPANTVWEKQNVGATGNANMVYMGFKAYAPDGAVGFKEGDRGVIVDEYFDFSGDFAGTDEFGRNYSICWFALASYNDENDTWTYFGKNSSVQKYIGWDYIVEWYDADGVVIESDSIRINLSNEDCHSVTEPYYVGKMMKEIETKIAEVSAYEIIEF